MTLKKLGAAKGGWIKNRRSSKKHAYQSLSDFEAPSLKEEYVKYFEDYRTRYYYESIMPEQGLEEILSALHTHAGAPGNWIDLGGGVVTLFWSTAVDVRNLRTIEVCDVVPEALYVLRRFVESSEIPSCYAQAVNFLNADKEVIQKNRSLPWLYHIFDCLNEWPENGLTDKYDLITAIGCFGLSGNFKKYCAALKHASKKLTQNGRLIGVDWVRSKQFIKEEGHDNSYIGANALSSCAENNNLKIRHIENVKIHGDPCYDELIIWSLSQK